MFDLMPDIKHEPVSIRHFRVCFCVLNGQLTVVRKGAAIVERPVDDLHLTIISGDSRANVKENKEADLWVVLSWS